MRQSYILLISFLLVVLGTACASAGKEAVELGPLTLPTVRALDAGNERLKVVATTSIIGDVVNQVGANQIDLTVLIGAGQDPHSFEPSARDLTRVSQAHVVFTGGWNLEEGLLDELANAAGETPLIPVAAGIMPLAAGGGGTARGQADTADPHTWLDPHHVLVWTDNIVQILSTVDPEHAAQYEMNGTGYKAELQELVAYIDERLAVIPPDRRKLVTNHDSLGYFARAYGFTVYGTVLPSASTLAEPSAAGLINLVALMKAQQICTIFAETTASRTLADAVARELDSCPQVQVLTLYTGALGLQGSGAENYLGMMRHNVDTLVAGLH